MNRPGDEPSRASMIAGRYVVLGEIAAGGMGCVYRVQDASTERVVALKRLLSGADATARVLFKREYHTLMTLRHPCIVEVYDYGIDEGGPYYTMEFVDGEDLRGLAPQPFDVACRYLRDVASSLSLVHAHRLLHRDVSPRNVRVTGGGHCKLLDFGALTPFGIPSEIVGTPASVPPEAIRALPLDQRADLYSLGVLAYYALTRRYPYRAHSMRELEALWREQPRPPPPSEAARSISHVDPSLPAIPKSLDELVLSLLSLDPLARPSSAAEVIERLNAIAQLTPDAEPHAAQGYLASGPMVGREREIQRVRRLVVRTLGGRGGALIVEHASGTGASRFLAEAAWEARLAGATVLQADANVHRGPRAAAQELVRNLLVVLPAQGLAAVCRDVQALGWIYPGLHARLGTRPERIDPQSNPGVWRSRVQTALRALFLDVARTHPLVVMVDGLAGVDDSTAALLAVLAEEGRNCKLLVVGALRSDDRVAARAALRRLSDTSARIVLRSLSTDDTTAWLRSVFGGAPNTERLAGWLYRKSQGHPLHLVELCRHLVSRGIARYADGTWILPQELPSDHLPERIEETLDRRLAELSARGRELAAVFSLHEGSLSLELCVAVAEKLAPEAFSMLNELVAAGVLVGHGSNYDFSQGAIQERLLSTISESARPRYHLLLGRCLLSLDTADLATTLEAGWHLFHGGEEVRGAELLRRVGLELAFFDELPAAVPALEAALGVFRKLKKPPHELLGLLAPLTLAGYYVDRTLSSKYGEETVELLAQEVGLGLAAKLRPWVGRHVSLGLGLLYGFILHFFANRGGARAFYDQIVTLSVLSCSQTGVATICLDADAARHSSAVLEPFSVLGTRHAATFSYRFCLELAGLIEDRAAETIEGLHRLLEQLDLPGGVAWRQGQSLDLIKGGLLYALGALEGFRDEPRALTIARELEGFGMRLYDMAACQVRTNYHACRGEMTLSEPYDRNVELHAIRIGSAWQAEVWAPVSRIAVCLLTGDILTMKRTAEELDSLSESVPSLRRYADMARGAYHYLRGSLDTAIPILERAVFAFDPRGYIGWCNIAATLAAAYNEKGEHERARSLCQSVLDSLSPSDRLIVALHLRIEIQLALAESGLALREAAGNRLDSLLAMHAKGEGPVTLGSLHAARARVAFFAGDRVAFEHHRAEMDHWFRSTDNPSLIAQCERMIGLSDAPPARTPVSRFRPSPTTTVSSTDSDGSSLNTDDAVTILDGCRGPVRRAQSALRMLVERSNASSGFLYGLKRGELVLLAPEHGDNPPGELEDVVKARIAAHQDAHTDTIDDMAENGHPFQTIVLATASEQPRVVGAAVLAKGPTELRSLAPGFVQELATALHDAGDVTGIDETH